MSPGQIDIDVAIRANPLMNEGLRINFEAISRNSSSPSHKVDPLPLPSLRVHSDSVIHGGIVITAITKIIKMEYLLESLRRAFNKAIAIVLRISAKACAE